MGQVANSSLQVFARNVVLVVVLVCMLLGAALGAAGRLPEGGLVSEAVSMAATTAGSTLPPALTGLRTGRSPR